MDAQPARTPNGRYPWHVPRALMQGPEFRRLKPAVKLVFLELWNEAGARPSTIRTSSAHVASVLGEDDRRIRERIKTLADWGLVDVVERYGDGAMILYVHDPAEVARGLVRRPDPQRALFDDPPETGAGIRPENGAPDSGRNPAHPSTLPLGADASLREGTPESGRNPARARPPASGKPGGETPTMLPVKPQKEAQALLQRSNEQLGSNGTIGDPPDSGRIAARPVDPDAVPTMGETACQAMQARARAIGDYEAATTPAAQRARLVGELLATAPNLDRWFAQYTAGQVLAGRIQEQDLRRIFEEMAAKDAAASEGVTEPIRDPARYLRELLRKLRGWVEPRKGQGRGRR